MGILNGLKRFGNSILHPKQAVERTVRRRVIIGVVGAVLAVTGWNVSPEFRDAVVSTIDYAITAFEERPEELKPDEQPEVK